MIPIWMLSDTMGFGPCDILVTRFSWKSSMASFVGEFWTRCSTAMGTVFVNNRLKVCITGVRAKSRIPFGMLLDTGVLRPHDVAVAGLSRLSIVASA